MIDNYRNKLFTSYQSTHESYVDADEKTLLEWFRLYAAASYLPHLQHLDRATGRILEIGCNKGYLLHALSACGFKQLHGVDLSPDDVQRAQSLVKDAQVVNADAGEYLAQRAGEYDVVILKAVLEHVPKSDAIPLLETIKGGLKPGGQVIVDVPNMDWLFAQHERYMDFTHESGFTRESLSQVMRNVYPQVQIMKGAYIGGTSALATAARAIRPLVLKSMNVVFRIIGEGASEIWWDCRSIVGVGKV